MKETDGAHALWKTDGYKQARGKSDPLIATAHVSGVVDTWGE